MPVKPRAQGIYHYRFKIDRQKFSGSTGTRDKREAERIEARIRREAHEQVRAAAARSRKGLTFGEAVELFWDQVGTFYDGGSDKGTYRKTVWSALQWLKQESGIAPTTLLRDVGSKEIASAIGRRRAETWRGQPVSNATVNRTVTELLRRIWLRSRDVWEEQVKRIEWDKLLLPEPEERVRELRSHEEPELLTMMRNDYLPAIRFLLKSGARKAEAVNLRKTDIDWSHGKITIHGKGRAGKPKVRAIPLTSELRDILEPLKDHPTECVFTYVARSARRIQNTDRWTLAGDRYPITLEGLKSAWKRFGPSKAGISDFRIHDLRHTAATRLLRQSGNLKHVQRLLGHSDLATSGRYAHVTDDDLIEAMEAETANRAHKSAPKLHRSPDQNEINQ
jgi:integrase